MKPVPTKLLRCRSSLVGKLRVRQQQAEPLGVKHHARMSGGLEKACWRFSANEALQAAAADITALTGIAVGHRTQQRLVGRQAFEFPAAKQGVSEVCLDGSKVRLRDREDSDSPWRDDKAARLEGIY